MDEIALKRTSHKGAQAVKLIEDHKELWDDVEGDLLKMWRDSASEDAGGREALYREYHAIKAVQARMQRLVDQGKRADEELKQQKVKADGNRSRT